VNLEIYVMNEHLANGIWFLRSSTSPVSLAEKDGHVYVINGHKGVLSNSLQIHQLDARHGIVQNDYKVPASIKDLTHVSIVNGHIVWIEKNQVKVNALGSSDVSSVAIEVGSTWRQRCE
jgi:hypothetical protein